MNIIWLGETSFQIISQAIKDNPVKIIIDPIKKGSGLKTTKLEADILIETSSKTDLSNIKGEPFTISGLGEFEIKEVFIQGIDVPAKQDKNQSKDSVLSRAYVFEAEGVRICHLGRLAGQDINNNGVMEKIGNIDILLISTGGSDGFAARQAAEIVKAIEPRVIVPMLYKTEKFSSDLDGLDKFLEAMGKKGIEPQNKFSAKNKDIVKMAGEIVALEP